jgi:hypothetical protein
MYVVLFSSSEKELMSRKSWNVFEATQGSWRYENGREIGAAPAQNPQARS